jgi:hypothetical protein
MKILIGTHSSMAEYNADCDYALLDLTPELARDILGKLELVREFCKRDNTVSLIEFAMFGNPEFTSYCTGTDAVMTTENLLREDVYKADGLILDESIQRVDVQTLIIYAEHRDSVEPLILFSAIPKHTSIEIETNIIPLDLITAISKGEI